MDTYSIEFYDLVARALGANNAKKLQGYLDEVLALKYNGLQLDGFKFAEDMQLDFTYEQIQKEVGLNVMAQYVDLDAPAIPYGGEGFQLGTGKIPRMKGVEYFNEDKVRKMMILEERFGKTADRVVNAAKNGLFTSLDKLIGGHTNSLTYQRHQIVSRGKFVLTDANNPNGIVNLTFASHVPAGNINNLSGDKRWYTQKSADGIYSTPGANCDPIKDLKNIVRKAKDKGVIGHFEIDEVYAEQVIDHPKVLEAIATRLYPLSTGDALTAAKAAVAQLNLADRLDVLKKIVGASFKTIDSIVSVEKWDNDRKALVRPTFRAFEDNVIVFVPDGNIGEVLTVEPIVVGGSYGGFYGGRGVIVATVDASKKCQAFESEMTSLAVPDKPQYMYYIHPYAAA